MSCEIEYIIQWNLSIPDTLGQQVNVVGFIYQWVKLFLMIMQKLLCGTYQSVLNI